MSYVWQMSYVWPGSFTIDVIKDTDLDILPNEEVITRKSCGLAWQSFPTCFKRVPEVNQRGKVAQFIVYMY